MCRSHRWAWYVVALGWLLGACATPPGEAAPDTFDVVLDPSVSRSTVQGAAWIVYGLARGKTYNDLKSVRHNPAAEDYLIELRARAALAEFWRDQQGKPDVPSDSYLDWLVEIDAAGNLEEHVLAALFKPGWTIPAPELERVDFSALEQALPRDETPTYAIARPSSGKLSSDIPGFDLPDPIALHPSQVPCTQSLPTLRGAIAHWERERVALDGASAAANSGAEFIALIAAARNDPPFRTRGATWVSPRPYYLLFVAGFCAIELEEYEQAEQWLESAVAMAPNINTARMELAHALVSQGKLDRADAIIAPTLATSQDRCELARAWRRRGYIRFEQRRLDEARTAYLRSLEYDPDSGIARSELELLRREVAQHGGNPEWYVPPPSSPDRVTRCPDAS
jgi:tetratricopeptide (TPR) repeat protein